MKRRSGTRWMMAVAGLAAAFLLGLASLGYLGGDPFTAMRPAHYRALPGAPVAILWSGDMGFSAGMGGRVAARLVRDGVPVIGVNSLNYFRMTRTPSDATALLHASIQRARAINPQGRLLLVGQSYGADMLHVALGGLGVGDRRQIALVALVVPGATVEFRASPSEIFTFAMAEADARPTARQLIWAPLLCIYGQEEASSLCPLLHQPNARSVALPGGHPLHGDVDALYGTLRAAMVRAHFTERP